MAKRARPAGAAEELVNDDGFTFKRKVRGRAHESAGAQHARDGVRTRSRTAPGQHAAAVLPKPSAELLYQKTKAMADLHKSIPTSWPESKRLRELCLSISAAEAKSVRETYVGGYEYVAFAVSEALEIFVRDVEEKMSRGDLNFLKSSSYMSKLDSRKMRLRQLKSRYEKEQSEWEKLLDDGAALGGEEDGPAGTELTAKMAAEDAAIKDAVRKGRESIEKDSLRNSIASACVTTKGKLSLSVETLCGMVDNVRRICNEADSRSREHTKDFMKESFKTFNHIDSPMHLVSQLAKK